MTLDWRLWKLSLFDQGQQTEHELLVEHGADIHRTDPMWELPAQGWAEYFRHGDVVEYLAGKAQSRS